MNWLLPSKKVKQRYGGHGLEPLTSSTSYSMSTSTYESYSRRSGQRPKHFRITSKRIGNKPPEYFYERL